MKENFEEFSANIRLTDNQADDAKTKYDGVCKTLHKKYYENEYDGKTKYLFGSYKTKTNIRPLTPMQDVDVLFKIPKETFDKFDDYKGNGQSALLQEIRDVIKKTYTTTEEIKAWGKIVLVKMSDDKHNVEVLPAFENEDGTFTIPNTEDGGSWENFDPRAQVKKFQNSNSEDKTNGLTADLGRMMKAWNRNTSSMQLSSFKLLESVIDFLDSEFTSGADYEEYGDVIKNFFEHLKNNCEDDDIKSHIKTAYNRAVKALEYMDNDKPEKACDEWRKIFGDKFPKCKKKEKAKAVVPPITNPQRLWSELN